MSWWIALAIGGLVLALGATVLLTARHLPRAFSASAATSGNAPAAGAASRSDAASDAPPDAPPDAGAGTTGRAVAPTPAAPATPATPKTPATPTATTPFQPTTLRLPAFGVTAAVDPVFTAGGVLAPPDDPARVGWWGAGALAAAPAGTTVVVGHVDGSRGPGALYRLVHARAGDRIAVAGAGGAQVTYRVTDLEYHGKDDPLPASLFAASGAPQLVLISCGGPFDRDTGQYADNVVVRAVPV